MTGRGWWWVAPAALAVALAGCGSSHRSSGNGEAAKPAAAVLADAVSTMRRARSYRLTGEISIDAVRTSVNLAYQGSSSFSLSLRQPGLDTQIVRVGGAAYANGNAAFYAQQGVPASAVALIAGRWVKEPAAENASLGSLTTLLSGATLARCLVEDPGPLRTAGTATVAGQPAVVLLDGGTRPGGTTSRYDIAAAGPPVVLHAVATASQRAGGPSNFCGQGSALLSQAGDELSFSAYDRPLGITAPAGALDIASLER
ncbi:MAG TPA: hypothetical protein VHX88_20190 [Solirubrobacteraceae bacterium]|jgi:hypothetical protein|nr:hypothetical protein [Solirubrobacteraceae bacterium]